MLEKKPEIEECLAGLLQAIQPIDRTEKVHITECQGRVLAEEIVSDKMVPPFPKSAMDGYAVRAEELAEASGTAPVCLQVAGELLAGDYRQYAYQPCTAIRVMTGSYVPEGYDAVIRQEDTDCGEQEVQIYAAVKPFANYCKVGEDIQCGDVVIPRDTRLKPLHVGLLAGIGREWVTVYEPAKIALLATGSELAELGQSLAPGQIYNSITYLLAADIRREQLTVAAMERCPDEEALLAEKLRRLASQADMVITTGAVSVGKKDIVPGVLAQLGAKKLFQGANIQPGTPTLASVLDGTVILSLSGNPYAAIANFEYYFWYAAAKLMHSRDFQVTVEEAELCSEYPKVNRLRRMVRAYAFGGKVTLPSDVHASSVIHNLTSCNCFMDLEPGRAVKPGDTVRIRYFKSMR